MTDGGSLAIYAAMMQSLDRGIGRVLEALERSRLERDTLVIFTSDNGGERYSYQWPFSFQKAYLREGGIRVPAIVRWPGVVPADRTTDSAGHHDGLDRHDAGPGGRQRRRRLSHRRAGRHAAARESVAAARAIALLAQPHR